VADVVLEAFVRRFGYARVRPLDASDDRAEVRA
jgi:hypothetical protein